MCQNKNQKNRIQPHFYSISHFAYAIPIRLRRFIAHSIRRKKFYKVEFISNYEYSLGVRKTEIYRV